MLHGFAASVELWRANLGALAKTQRVLAVDLPGFGRSDKPRTDYSLAGLSRFVRDFLDAISVPRASLIGHSLGGGVALRFALDYPARPQRLALVAPAGLGREGHALLRAMCVPGLGELLARPSRAGTALLYRLATHDRRVVSAAVIDAAHTLARLPGAPRSALSALRAIGTVRGQRPEVYGPLVAALPGLTLPALVLWGRDDRILPAVQAETARAIPGVVVEIWPECGHLPMMEYPVRFNRTVGEFIAEGDAQLAAAK